jgi:GNAT superfamily N-acetyltransferase
MIRNFVAGDQVAFRELVQAGMRERWGPQFDPAANPDLDDIWSNYIVAKGAVAVVIEVEGDVVGTGVLIPDGNSSWIVRMSVASTHRRRGHASAIVAALVGRAVELGARTVAVKTDTVWPDAVELYRACGFTLVSQDSEETNFEMVIAAQL